MQWTSFLVCYPAHAALVEQRKRQDRKIIGVGMIACEDLQQLCRVILEVHHCLYGINFPSRDHTIVIVDVVNRGDQMRTCSKDCSIPMNARVQRLLEPFRRLYYIGNVIITGQVNEEHTNDIVASMMEVPLVAEDMINTACATKAQIDEAFHNKNSPSSVSA